MDLRGTLEGTVLEDLCHALKQPSQGKCPSMTSGKGNLLWRQTVNCSRKKQCLEVMSRLVPVEDKSLSLLNGGVQTEKQRGAKKTLKTGEILMGFQLLRRLLWDCGS